MKILRLLFSWGVLFTIVAAVFWFATITDRQMIDETSEDLMQRQALLARLQSLPKRESQIRAALETLNDGLAQRSLYSGDASSIRTEVQRDVRSIASAAKIRVGSMRPLGGRRTGDELNLSAIQLSYTATHKENLEFLKRLENAEPILRVQRMSMTVQTASTATAPANLSVTMEVAGYQLREQSPR